MKKKSKRVVVETKVGRSGDRGVTYQRELVLCGKPKCRKRHGPYWYAYWTVGGRTRTRYIGKVWRTLHDAEERAVLGNSLQEVADGELPKTGPVERRRRAENGTLSDGRKPVATARPSRLRQKRRIAGR